MDVSIESYATAAIGIVNRCGLAKVRHLAVSDLWIQQRSRSGEIKFHKVNGLDNMADSLTKALDGPDLARHCRAMSTVFLDGRHALAPDRVRIV